MPSPLAFTLGTGDKQEIFYDPAQGKQAEVAIAISTRVTTRQPAPGNLFVWGNRGGGKSRLVRSLLHGFALAFPGFKYVVVRRNMPDLRSNHLIYLGSEMRKLGGEWLSTTAMADYGNGSLGFYRQCEEEKDVEKVVGSEAAVLFVDEAPQIAWDWLRLMGPSLRVPKNADGSPAKYRTMVIYGGNPIGESVEDIWKYFVDRDVEPESDPEYNPADFQAIEMRLEDNPFLDAAEYRKQFAGIPAHYRAAWVDGVRMDSRTLFDVRKTITDDMLTSHGGEPRLEPLPASMLGKPYHYIQELPLVDGRPLLEVPWIQIYRTYDHGYFPDPAVAIWYAVFGPRVIAFHEETWFRKIAEDSADAMQEIHRELVGETPCAMTYIDPDLVVTDGKDAITVRDKMELRGVPCEPSINNRVMIADAIHSLLGIEVAPGVPKFQVYERGCPMLAKYLPKMRWDEKNRRKMADHKFDHYAMNVGYFGVSSGVIVISEAMKKMEPECIGLKWLREDNQGRRRRAM